jgi:hypothetical protein
MSLEYAIVDKQPGERQPLLNNEHTTLGLCISVLTGSILHQPGPQRNLQDSIHEEESLKQIVDRTIRYGHTTISLIVDTKSISKS